MANCANETNNNIKQNVTHRAKVHTKKPLISNMKSKSHRLLYNPMLFPPTILYNEKQKN